MVAGEDGVSGVIGLSLGTGPGKRRLFIESLLAVTRISSAHEFLYDLTWYAALRLSKVCLSIYSKIYLF